ncbi:MAG: SOS response-associated peptidase [Firmicutes bacterium]|nr:SOS response-associated peptidase [Bacillota bacterium]
MCGRYLLTVDLNTLLARYRLNDNDIQISFSPMNEIFPSNKVPVVLDKGERQIKMLSWGFNPSYAKRLIINARGETVDFKPTFKYSFLNKRCLIPATGFYEWEKVNGKSIKHQIFLDNAKIFSFAGIYNTFKDKNGRDYEAFTIITTTPSKDIERIHNRMPVILKKEDEDIWLDENNRDIGVLKSLLKPYDDIIIR